MDLIREINSKNESIEGKILTKILLAKICIDLIENFLSQNTYSKENDEELNNIKEKNEKIISENKKYFEKNEIKLENEEEEENEDEEDNQNFIIGYQIDKIYADIINSLIKNKKIENNYNNVIDILNQIDIENINITEEIYDKLNNTLNENEIISSYKIEKKDDIFNETKINFYYILIRYIFKHSLYIYRLDFFRETRKIILNILRNDKEIKEINKEEPSKERTNFVIRKLVDVDYFFENGYSESKKKLEIILEYYKEILFESKKDEITLIENIINTNQKIDNNLLKDYNKAENIHNKIPIIKYLYENDNKVKKKKKKTEKVMKEVVESWNNMEKFIREQKIQKIKADKRKLIYNYIINNEENKNIFLKIFGEDIYYNFININESLEPKNVKHEDKNQKIAEKQQLEKQKEEKEKEKIEKEKEKEEKKKIEKEKEEEEMIGETIDMNEQEKKEEKKEEKINEEKKYEDIDEDELYNKPGKIINNQMNSTKGEESIVEQNSNLINNNNTINNNNSNINTTKTPKEDKSIIEEDKTISFISEPKMDLSKVDEPNKHQISFDLKAPKASIFFGNKPQREISDMPNLISSKFSTLIYSNEIRDESYPFLNYKDIHIQENNYTIEYNKFMEYKEDIFYIKEDGSEVYQNLIKFFEYLIEIEERLRKEFENEFRLNILLELIREKENINDNNIYNITAYYTFFDPLKKNYLKYKDSNILINKTNSNLQGFEFMLSDINSAKYKDIKYSYEEYGIKNIKIKNQDSNIIINDNDLYEKGANEYSIIEYIKTIGKTKYSADFIKILSNGYYIIGSQDILYIYDNKFLLISSLTTRCNDWVHSVCERILYKKKKAQNNINDNSNINNEKNDEIKILCCMNSCIGLLELNIPEKKKNLTFIETKYKSPSKKKSKKEKEKEQLGNTYNICLEMRENNYVMAGLRGAVYCLNFFGNRIQIEQIKFSEQSFKSGIKLNENIVALTSNKVVPGGSDKLIFYNVKSKNNIEIENYSFNINEHNMSLITYGKKDSNEKILICACKKYYPYQKNGILLINPNLGENEKIKEPFYSTDNYEVYCFCPILKKINKNEFFDDTVFFFVGGFDEKKQQGVIKLYKIIPGEKTVDTKIKFLQNIDFDDNDKIFNGFDTYIKCMVQSKSTGNIIVTCADGNIHLFTKPNLELYNEN